MEHVLCVVRHAAIVCAAVACGFTATAGLEPFAVDFSQAVGKIRPLNGLCNATPLYNSRTRSINDKVLKLEIPYYRFHDASLENPGIELVDVCRIFPLFHADADDPRNYDFRATDDYLRQVVDAGAEIEFRLGESIEHSKNQYFVHPPKDYGKWAEICVHIIRHYNEGWADGFRWNIRRWSIWEEPDTNPMLLTGAPNPMVDIYQPLYKAAVTRIKQEFPRLLVGAPHSYYGDAVPFVEFCAKEKLPIDFLGITSYVRKPEQLAAQVRAVRKLLDDNGFAKTPISVGEWHLAPIGWGGHGTVNAPRYAKAWADEMSGTLSTAFTASVLMHMQDKPVDFMHYYSIKGGSWGLFDRSNHPYGSYWAMHAFAQLAHGDVRVAAQLRPRDNWWVLASKETKTGVGRVLVATMRTDDSVIPITLKGGVRPVSVKVIDLVQDFEESADWKWDEKSGKLTLCRNLGDSTVWLIEVK